MAIKLSTSKTLKVLFFNHPNHRPKVTTWEGLIGPVVAGFANTSGIGWQDQTQKGIYPDTGANLDRVPN